jgi:hypothetical protein
MKMRTQSSKTRVQLDLRSEDVQALEALQVQCGLRARADAVRMALGVLAWVRAESTQGRRVVAVGKNEVSVLVLPGITT